MTRGRLFVVLVLVAAVARVGPAQATLPAEARDSLRAAVRRHLTYLTRPELVGRATGHPGSDSAAEYLAAQYQAMQIAAASPVRVCTTGGSCAKSYFQSFELPSLVRSMLDLGILQQARNVVATVPGTDPALAGEWIVIGGHFDHLGTTGFGSLDRAVPKGPHLGADDNASGTAAVLVLARRIADAPLRRPVMFVNFGAEEVGLVGSSHFVRSATVPMSSISAMFNFDMVGRLRKGTLEVIGMGSSPDWEALLTSARTTNGLLFLPTELVDSGSDHMPFAAAGVPVLHFHTGEHTDWHTRGDTMRKLNIDGIVQVIEFAELVIRAVGDRDAALSRVPVP